MSRAFFRSSRLGAGGLVQCCAGTSCRGGRGEGGDAGLSSRISNGAVRCNTRLDLGGRLSGFKRELVTGRSAWGSSGFVLSDAGRSVVGRRTSSMESSRGTSACLLDGRSNALAMTICSACGGASCCGAGAWTSTIEAGGSGATGSVGRIGSLTGRASATGAASTGRKSADGLVSIRAGSELLGS